MRATSTKTEHGFEAKAISGIHTILIALNCPDASRKGLKGFAFEREMVGPNSKGPKFLRSQKVFKSVVPDPKNAHDPNSPIETRGVLHRQIPGAELPVGRLRGRAGHQTIASASCRCSARRARSRPTRRTRSGSRFRPRRNSSRARPTACGSTAAPLRGRNSPRSSATSRRRTSTTRTIRRSNGSRAACSRPACNTSTRPSRATRCASRPTSSPMRRSSKRSRP